MPEADVLFVAGFQAVQGQQRGRGRWGGGVPEDILPGARPESLELAFTADDVSKIISRTHRHSKNSETASILPVKNLEIA